MGYLCTTHGYICVYSNEYYNKYDLCTFGRVIDLEMVKRKYNKFEVVPGNYLLILKVPYNILYSTVIKLKTTFAMIGYKKIMHDNIYYNKKIIELIPRYLDNINVKYEDYTNIILTKNINDISDDISDDNSLSVVSNLSDYNKLHDINIR